MLNFRMTDNGTLAKREGYAYVASLPNMIRGTWEGTLGGYSYSFCVAGNTLYQMQSEDFSTTMLYSLSTYDGPVEFCESNGYLYLLDGKTILCFDPNNYSFLEAEPYAPLLGINWHPTSLGESNELPNLLTPRMRVHYRNTIGTTSFTLPYYAKSVDCVYAGTREIYTYSFTANTNVVTIPEAATESEIIIAFSAPFDEYTRRNLLAAKRAFALPTEKGSRLLLYDTIEKQKLYLSTPVTENMKNYCQVFYPYTVPLYFTSLDLLFVGDSLDPIVTICPYYDAALIFNQNSIRLISYENDAISAKVILTGIGCIARNGAQNCGTDIITVSKNGIYRLSAKTSAIDMPSAERISDVVQARIKNVLRENTIVFWNDFYRELWMCSPQDESGQVWVWNAVQNAWYLFDDMMATGFFNSKIHGVCICNGNVIHRMTPNSYSDNGNSYISSYRSKYLDLGNPDFVHRSMRWSLTCSGIGVSKTLVFYTPRGAVQCQLVRPYNTTEPEHYEGRIHTHRHRFFRFQFSAIGSQATSLYRVAFYSKP